MSATRFADRIRRGVVDIHVAFANGEERDFPGVRIAEDLTAGGELLVFDEAGTRTCVNRAMLLWFRIRTSQGEGSPGAENP